MKTQLVNTAQEFDFSYLNNDDIDSPLYCIGYFYTKQVYIEELRQDIHNWVKTACSLSNDQFGDPDQFPLIHQHCTKLLEIAYLLQHDDIDLRIDKDHPIYRLNNDCFGWHIENTQTLSCPDLYYRNLLGDEINDVKTFFEDLFEFNTLDQWYKILGLLFIHSKQETSFTQQEEYGYMIIEIQEYLEKALESISVVYETQALPYLNKYYPELFD
ncbi:hypothetical protein OQX61_20340 [Pedobacter sp. PLR]|uniref:hypothetical protein n=1 Tax=Pedobacter sp. PLR TaxID=2994465 RepID=UPI0022468611|nr:hypothetical protein [Pedobacter sp. PLR]MCX2453632.1 hypothetical protein [Pedobacter sp. PLR]